MQQMTYRIVEYSAYNDTLFHLRIVPEDGATAITYQAGQYVKFLLPNQRELLFSIANAPRADQQLEFFIRLLPQDLDSVLLQKMLQKKGNLTLTGAYGNCIYRQSEQSLILIAGGTGLAPMKAILEQASQHQDRCPMHLYWSIKQQQDFPPQNFLPFLVALPHFHYDTIISRTEDENWHGRKGFVADAVLADYDDLSHHHFYLSGPPAMVFAVCDALLKKGILQRQICSDLF